MRLIDLLPVIRFSSPAIIVSAICWSEWERKSRLYFLPVSSRTFISSNSDQYNNSVLSISLKQYMNVIAICSSDKLMPGRNGRSCSFCACSRPAHTFKPGPSAVSSIKSIWSTLEIFLTRKWRNTSLSRNPCVIIISVANHMSSVVAPATASAAIIKSYLRPLKFIMQKFCKT